DTLDECADGHGRQLLGLHRAGVDGPGAQWCDPRRSAARTILGALRDEPARDQRLSERARRIDASAPFRSNASSFSKGGSIRPQLLNPAQLPAVFRKEFELCAVKPGETIILLSNLNTRREYILAATAAAEDVGAHVFEINLNRVSDPSRVRR